MSDTRDVESDTSGGEVVMRAFADTAGMSTPESAYFWLAAIAKHLHRGPKIDTWTSARDRAAEYAGIEPSLAKRIWQRVDTMKKVDGDAVRRLIEGYERMCAAVEGAADRYEEQTRRRVQNAAHARTSEADRSLVN